MKLTTKQEADLSSKLIEKFTDSLVDEILDKNNKQTIIRLLLENVIEYILQWVEKEELQFVYIDIALYARKWIEETYSEIKSNMS